MAKKSASGINKSELIRQYVTANPLAKPKAVAEALTAQHGVEFKSQVVSTLLSNERKKASKPPERRGRKPRSIVMAGGITIDNGVAPTPQSFSQAMPIFKAAAELLKVAGNRATAREVLDLVAALRS